MFLILAPAPSVILVKLKAIKETAGLKSRLLSGTLLVRVQ